MKKKCQEFRKKTNKTKETDDVGIQGTVISFEDEFVPRLP